MSSSASGADFRAAHAAHASANCELSIRSDCNASTPKSKFLSVFICAP
jgi:hypothetical protein